MYTPRGINRSTKDNNNHNIYKYYKFIVEVEEYIKLNKVDRLTDGWVNDYIRYLEERD